MEKPHNQLLLEVDPAGELFCPVNPKHALSADKEPHSYYCYECAEHYSYLEKPHE